jgi:formylglycine-generating enzyme required for sulfatase activity
MDATEVTDAHYQVFLAAAASPDGGVPEQESYCSWNTSYRPGSGAPPKDDFPVTGVDWCDAYAYCKWAGKHLCGRIGGGLNPFNADGDPSSSEWFNACSQGGTRRFPYGHDYDPKACNGYDTGFLVTVLVGTLKKCEGGYPGLFDLSGNVAEWEDSCDGHAGRDDACKLRGGSYLSTGNPFNSQPDGGGLLNDMRCRSVSQASRSDSTASGYGFRCCADSL